MVLLLAKNSKVRCLFRPNFLKQVVIEIQKMAHPRQKFSKYPGAILASDKVIRVGKLGLTSVQGPLLQRAACVVEEINGS